MRFFNSICPSAEGHFFVINLSADVYLTDFQNVLLKDVFGTVFEGERDGFEEANILLTTPKP
jgi:hypothetical protein